MTTKELLKTADLSLWELRKYLKKERKFSNSIEKLLSNKNNFECLKKSCSWYPSWDSTVLLPQKEYTNIPIKDKTMLSAILSLKFCLEVWKIEPKHSVEEISKAVIKDGYNKEIQDQDEFLRELFYNKFIIKLFNNNKLSCKRFSNVEDIFEALWKKNNLPLLLRNGKFGVVCGYEADGTMIFFNPEYTELFHIDMDNFFHSVKRAWLIQVKN